MPIDGITRDFRSLINISNIAGTPRQVFVLLPLLKRTCTQPIPLLCALNPTNEHAREAGKLIALLISGNDVY